MIKKLAKLKYLPNNFKIIEEGDHVICAISGKVIKLEELNYWNVDLQEAYYSYVEASKKKRITKILLNFPSIMRPYPLSRVFNNHCF
jgi:hypothetical protein